MIIVKQLKNKNLVREDWLNLLDDLEDQLYLFKKGAKLTPELYAHYGNVAEINCNELHEAWVIMNRNSFEDQLKITYLAPSHSLSVGDILVKDNVEYVVGVIGFPKLNKDLTAEFPIGRIQHMKQLGNKND